MIEDVLRRALSAMPASEATKPAPDAPKPEREIGMCAKCGHGEGLHGSTQGCLSSGRHGHCGCTRFVNPQPEREAQGEPTLERCLTVFGLAYNEAKVGASPMATDTEAWCERQGIAAVRSLCLAHRAPSPSPALAAIVEAGDAMKEVLVKTLWHEKHAEWTAWMQATIGSWDRARAALPKGGAA